MSRLVTIPAHVIAIHPITKKPIVKVDFDKDGKPVGETPDDPWTEYRFLVQYVLNRPEWIKPLKKQREGGNILDKFEDVEPGSVVELTDDQWRNMRDTLEDETEDTGFELPSHFGYQLVVFADAIINAPEAKAGADEDAPQLEAVGDAS